MTSHLYTLAATTLLLTGLSGIGNAVQVGNTLPTTELNMLNETPKTLKAGDIKKPTYLKFWASWCAYCLEEMPHLQDVYNQHGDDIDVVAVNIGMNDTAENIHSLFVDQGLSVPVALDQSGKLSQQYNIIGTPTHILIDENGTVVYRSHLVTDQLNAYINQFAMEL